MWQPDREEARETRKEEVKVRAVECNFFLVYIAGNKGRFLRRPEMRPKPRQCTLFITLLLFLVSMPAVTAEPEFVYQRIHATIAHYDNRISLRTWPEGTMEARFPAYTRQAGVYRWQATPEHHRALAALFSRIASIRHDRIDLQISQRRDTGLVEIHDADHVRFSWRQAGQETFELVIEAPDTWSRALPDLDELADLARLEADLLDWIEQRAREVGQ